MTAFPCTSSLSNRTMEQIIALIALHWINIEICNVQMQHGGSDCGLFALAFAESLCTGKDPAKTTYVQHRLRQHLVTCLNSLYFTCFPKQTRARQNRPSKVLDIQIYCHCRQPYDRIRTGWYNVTSARTGFMNHVKIYWLLCGRHKKHAYGTVKNCIRRPLWLL